MSIIIFIIIIQLSALLLLLVKKESLRSACIKMSSLIFDWISDYYRYVY